MAKRTLVTGIDIGSATARVVVAEYTNDSTPPVVLGTGTAAAHGMRHGYIVNFEEAKRSIAAAVKDAQRRTGFTIKKAFLSVGGISLESINANGSVFVYRADNEITESDVRRALESAEEKLSELSNKEILHAVPVRYKIDDEEVWGRPVGMKGTRLEVTTLFVTCLSQHLKDFVDAVEDIGISVEDVMAAPLAASFVTLTKRQKTAGCLLANVGAETLSIAVFENGLPISLKVFPIGGAEITHDIALGFRVPLEEAEEIKRGENTVYPKKKTEDIIEARLSDIFDLIEGHLKKINKNGLLPAGIVITGGSSALPAIDELAKNSLKLPAHLGTPHIIKTTTAEQIPDSQWSVAYGLCIMGLSEGSDGAGGPSVFRKLWEWFRQFMP